MLFNANINKKLNNYFSCIELPNIVLEKSVDYSEQKLSQRKDFTILGSWVLRTRNKRPFRYMCFFSVLQTEHSYQEVSSCMLFKKLSHFSPWSGGQSSFSHCSFPLPLIPQNNHLVRMLRNYDRPNIMWQTSTTEKRNQTRSSQNVVQHSNY